jgi:hypothetical protein
VDHLSWSVPSVGSGRVGSVSLFDVLGQGRVFLGWIGVFLLLVGGFWVGSGFVSKITAFELLRVKKYSMCPLVALVGSGRAEFFSGGLVVSGDP